MFNWFKSLTTTSQTSANAQTQSKTTNAVVNPSRLTPDPATNINEDWTVLRQSNSEEDFQLLNSSTIEEEPANEEIQFDPTPASSRVQRQQTPTQQLGGEKRKNNKKPHSQKRKTIHNIRKQEKLRKQQKIPPQQQQQAPAQQEQQHEQGMIPAAFNNLPLTITGLMHSMSKLLVSTTKPKAPSKSYRKFRFDKEFKIPNKESGKRPQSRAQPNLVKHGRKM